MSEEPVDYSTEVEEALELLRGNTVVEFGETRQEIVETDTGQIVRTRGGIWIKLHTSFRNRLLKDLQGSKLAVFICIGLHVDGKNECYPTIKTISGETGYSEREVVRAIQELETINLIGVTRQHRKANYYSVNAMMAYGNGNDPIGEVLTAKKSPKENASKVTQDLLQKSPQGEPYKENQIISGDEKQSPVTSQGITHASMPEGLNEVKSKALKFRCEFCDERNVISWRDETCPNCQAKVIWEGNKWLDRILANRHKDTVAKQQGPKKHGNPAVDYIQQLCGCNAKPEDIAIILKYVSANGLEAFQAMCNTIHTADKEIGKFDRGIMTHIVNSCPGYGKNGYAPKSEPAKQPETPTLVLRDDIDATPDQS